MRRISENLDLIRERIAGACRRAGRAENEVRLCGVSKFHPRSAVDEAKAAGLRFFGENRVQEAVEKFPLPGRAEEVHLIGTLQRNKARIAVEFFDCVQSVDRLSLIDELGKLTATRTKPLPVLFELHTAEDSKSGFANVDALLEAADCIAPYKGLLLQGLMTMAPNTQDEKPVRAAFRALVSAQKALERHLARACPVLSMGMSGDFELAIEEGSTMVRIGTAIFGER